MTAHPDYNPAHDRYRLGAPDYDEHRAWNDDSPKGAMRVVAMTVGACGFVCAAALALAVWLILASSYAETGPGCPGADPAWIGFCSDAPEVL